MTIKECIKTGLHLINCDDDGFCNQCGHQEEDIVICPNCKEEVEVYIFDDSCMCGECGEKFEK